MSSMLSYFKVVSVVAAIVVAMHFAACKKEDTDPGTLPQIGFAAGPGYITESATLDKETSATVNVVTSKYNDGNELKTFTISVSYNDSTAKTLETKTLSGDDAGVYKRVYKMTTRPISGKETYIFSVTDKNGKTNSIGIVLTVK